MFNTEEQMRHPRSNQQSRISMTHGTLSILIHEKFINVFLCMDIVVLLIEQCMTIQNVLQLLNTANVIRSVTFVQA